MISTDLHSVDLRNQVAIVTGGGRGIGRAIAITLAAAGARVAVLARNRRELSETAAAIENSGGHACVVLADVTSKEDVASAILEAENCLGPLDIAVNNAGVLGPIGPFAETDPDSWWRTVEVNLRGPMLVCRAVLPGMISRGRGRMINVVTGAAPYPFFSGYVAGKTALVRFSECLAEEIRPHGLAVFSMGPGTVRTAMSEHSLYSEEGRRWIPWFRRIFDEGLDLPVERPAELALQLASGRYDVLTGLTLTPRDNLNDLISQFEKIGADKLYSLRMRTLPGAQPEGLSAIREAGERPRR